MDALYTDRWQCLDFEVDYFDPDSLTIRADVLLKSKRGGYDSKHRAFLEPLGQAQLVLFRTDQDTIGPGWWRVRVVKRGGSQLAEVGAES